MITVAVAALAVVSLAHQTKSSRPPGYLLPLYDLVISGAPGSNLTANFMLSNLGAPNNDRFRAFFYDGDASHFTPTGNWVEITGGSWSTSSGTVTFTCPFPGSSSQGTLWIQYSGEAADSINGAEFSITAAGYGVKAVLGQESRPGAVVPIINRVPDLAVGDLPVTFTMYAPFGGDWGDISPTFWENLDTTPVAAPGGGWQPLARQPIFGSTGSRQVTTNASPQRPSGFYMVGVQETYIPSQSYNPQGTKWTEFSAVMRPFSLG